jgi:hypothetical protein
MSKTMGWGGFVKIPQSTIEGLKEDRAALEWELEILEGVIERLQENQIPMGTAPAPVCTNPECESYGQPHVFDCATHTVIAKPKRPKPAPAKKRKRRIRIAADVTPANRQALHDLAASYGLTWSQFCQRLATGEFWPIESK